MGQFDSSLLGPTEVETWDTLMAASDPNWNVPAPAPAYEPAADQMYAPAQDLSYAAPYEAPAPVSYAPDSPIYAPAPELSYGGPPEPAYVDPFMAGDATQQYQDPFMQQAYAPAPYVNNSGAILPGSLDSWESPSNFSENEAFSTINGEDIGGRSTPGPAPTPGFFESRNPQFAESNAQFDATTNPANRGGPGLLGGAMNLGAAAVEPIPQLVDFANMAGEAVARNRSLSNTFTAPTLGAGTGQVYGGQESLTQPLVDLLLPQTPLDVALTLAPGLGLFDNAGQTALRGYGQNFDTLGRAAGQIDELPIEAARGALTRASENPAFAPDVDELVATRRVFPTAGAADDAGETPFAAAKKTLQDQFAGMNKGEIRATLEGAGFADDIVTNKNGVLNTDKTYDAVARKVAGEGPTPRVQAPEPQLPGMGGLDDVSDETRKALNLSPNGAPKDIIDDVTEQVLRDAEGWPVATPGSQAGLFDEPVQGFMEQAAGPTSYMPGQAANPDVGLNQLRLNRGLQETAGNFDPNAVAPESGFLRNEPTAARMQSADGPANYAPGAKVDSPEVSLQQQKLAKAASENPGNLERGATAPDSGFMQGQPTTPAMQSAPGPAKYEWQAVPELEVPLRQQVLIKAAKENPSTSTLTPLVEEIFKGKLGQQSFDINVARANKPLWSQAIDEAIGLTGLPRELKASFDMSIPGRQGLALAFRHPNEWFDSWKTVLPAMGSENGFRIVNADAENLISKWRQVAGDGVVHLNTIDRTAKGTERISGFEAAGNTFASNISKRLGTGKFERSAVAFINHQRATTMDTMFTSIQKAAQAKREALRIAGNADPAALTKIAQDEASSYRNIAAIIDHATGYGGAPLKGDLMSRLFFSQRFMTSRFQFLVDPVVEGLARGDMKAARAATENLVAFAGGSATLLALIDAGAEKAGVDALNVEWDPRSSDFGKIRVGPARIDFGAGFLPLLRSVAQIGTGKRATVTGDILPIQKFDADTFKKESYVKASGNIALGFFRNKLDPVTQELVSRAFYGTDPVGNKPTQLLSTNTLENMFAPLLLSSTLESMRQGAAPGATAALAGSEVFGGSGSTYGQGQAAQQDIAQQKYGADYSKLPSQYQAQINAEAIANGVDVDIGSRLAPWWDSRNDAVEFYKSQVAPGQESDPRIAAALEATDYQDLGQRLQMVFEQEYGMTRADAEKEVTKTLDAMVKDTTDAYRRDITAADPGFAVAWLNAYNARETKYKPPVWVQELAEGK